MSFDAYLADAGFELTQTYRDGSQRFVLKSNPFLRWWLTARPDGTADLTWELELGAYLRAKGFAISVQDELSLMLFPETDVRGPADEDWLAAEMARTQGRLGSLDLAKGV